MRSILKKTRRILFVTMTVILLMVCLFLGQVFIRSAVDEQDIMTIAMAGTAEAASASLVCDGEDDHVQWQDAVDHLPNGGIIRDICGTTYTFGDTATLNYDNIVIEGVGKATYFENDGNTTLFSDGGHSNCLFVSLSTDAGGITRNNTNDSYAQNVWIGGTYYFEGPISGAEGNCTEVFKTITADSGTSPVADDCSDTLTIAGGTHISTVGNSGTETITISITNEDWGDFTIAAGVATLDTGVVADNEIDYTAVTLLDFDYQTAWRIFYSDGSGDVTELVLGSDGQYLKSQGASSAPTWETPGGSGDITAVGDVATGAAFTSDGTAGTSLWFYDEQGRGQLTIADLTAVRTYTLPDATGEVSLLGQSIAEAELDIDNSPTDEHVLTYESDSGKLHWQAEGGGVSQLSDLTDVGTVLYTSGYVLVADGSDYDSAQLAHSQLSNDETSIHLGVDTVKDTHIDWGTGASQVSASDVPDEDVGDITITTGAWAVEDESHAHTTTSISGLDISADTNLIGGTGITLTDDTLSCDLGDSIDISDETNLAVLDPVSLTGDTVGLNYDATLTLSGSDLSVVNDGHSHTGTSLSGIDISDDTNLTAGDHITLTDDDLDVDDDFLLNTGDVGTGDYDFTGAVLLGATPLVLEGATANDHETSFAVTDPTADRTITLPDATGEVSLLGQSISNSEIADGDHGDFTYSSGTATLDASYRLESDTDYIDKTHLSQDFGASSKRLLNYIPDPLSGVLFNTTGLALAGAGPFEAVINGGPNATTVAYDGETSEGFWTSMTAHSATYWGRVVLHNTTVKYSGTCDTDTTNELHDSADDFTVDDGEGIAAVGDEVLNSTDELVGYVSDVTNAASGRLGIEDASGTAYDMFPDGDEDYSIRHCVRYVETVNTATNTITTTSSTDDWADDDTIDVESQLYSMGTAAEWVEWDFSVSTEIDADTVAVVLSVIYQDKEGAADTNRYMGIGPFATEDGGTSKYIYLMVASEIHSTFLPMKLNHQRICFHWTDENESIRCTVTILGKYEYADT